jgi:hypothetical protein
MFISTVLIDPGESIVCGASIGSLFPCLNYVHSN